MLLNLSASPSVHPIYTAEHRIQISLWSQFVESDACRAPRHMWNQNDMAAVCVRIDRVFLAETETVTLSFESTIFCSEMTQLKYAELTEIKQQRHVERC